MLILSTVRFWELSRACSIWTYELDHHVYMDMYSSHRRNVKFIYLGEVGDSEEVIAAAIDAYFQKNGGIR